MDDAKDDGLDHTQRISPLRSPATWPHAHRRGRRISQPTRGQQANWSPPGRPPWSLAGGSPRDRSVDGPDQGHGHGGLEHVAGNEGESSHRSAPRQPHVRDRRQPGDSHRIDRQRREPSSSCEEKVGANVPPSVSGRPPGRAGLAGGRLTLRGVPGRSGLHNRPRRVRRHPHDEGGENEPHEVTSARPEELSYPARSSGEDRQPR